MSNFLVPTEVVGRFPHTPRTAHLESDLGGLGQSIVSHSSWAPASTPVPTTPSPPPMLAVDQGRSRCCPPESASINRLPKWDLVARSGPLPPFTDPVRDHQHPAGVLGPRRRPCGAAALRVGPFAGLGQVGDCGCEQVAVGGLPGHLAGLGAPLGCSEFQVVLDAMGTALTVFEKAPRTDANDSAYLAAKRFYADNTSFFSAFRFPLLGESCRNTVASSMVLLKALNASITTAGGSPVPLPDVQIDAKGGPADTLDKVKTLVVATGVIVGVGAVLYLAGPALRAVAQRAAGKLRGKGLTGFGRRRRKSRHRKSRKRS